MKWLAQFKKKQQLKRSRQAFLKLTADGSYSRERQHRLYQWCQVAGLDWDEARHAVRDDAQRLLQRSVAKITASRPLSLDDMAEIHSLQRRLGLDPATPTTQPSPAPGTTVATLKREFTWVRWVCFSAFCLVLFANRLTIAFWGVSAGLYVGTHLPWLLPFFQVLQFLLLPLFLVLGVWSVRRVLHALAQP